MHFSTLIGCGTVFALGGLVATALPTDSSVERHLEEINIELRSSSGWDYGTQKVRGVNIGGWLVAEPWITPSLFSNTSNSNVVDEWTMGQYMSDACTRLKKHWKNFYTESDFEAIAAAGLNHVRIPIGYWAYADAHGDYCKSTQNAYLVKAVGWAKTYGLKVLIDLHGAPGSQNGFDNSGRRTSDLKWFASTSQATKTKEVIATIAKQFTTSEYSGTVTAIELLNEPETYQTSYTSVSGLSFVKSYYKSTYDSVRYGQGTSSSATSAAVFIHDGFQSLSTWDGFMTSSKYSNVVLDHHEYTVFSATEIAYNHTQRLAAYCNLESSLASSQENLWTVVGEWTSAPTDCAKWLNGRGYGARYDGTLSGYSKIGSCTDKTGDASGFSSTYKQQLKELFDTQRYVYETGSGWIYWTWKAESADDWSYEAGVTNGWITTDLDDEGDQKC